jgi:hypothetical protein
VVSLPQSYTHLVEYIPTLVEYRVHIAFGSSIKISQKYLQEPTEHFVPWIRNRRTGYVYRAADDTVGNKAGIRATAKAAVEALELSFGAVDLIVSDKGIPYVLEVNTAPGLIPAGIRKYGAHIGEALGITTFNEEHLNTLREGVDDETPENID